ncbi:MAG TPA: protein kinase, partial [Kofleriaceae bacterium]|nr:protein kinase [Kofleriaceae bacterium]
MVATLPPPVVGYRVERLIGEGGFGQVWRARKDSGELVAIKVLHLELVRSIDAMTRFERELEAIDRLRNRHVVAALDHGTLGDGRPYLVLEY